jgi:hypothetical protein
MRCHCGSVAVGKGEMAQRETQLLVVRKDERFDTHDGSMTR